MSSPQEGGRGVKFVEERSRGSIPSDEIADTTDSPTPQAVVPVKPPPKGTMMRPVTNFDDDEDEASPSARMETAGTTQSLPLLDGPASPCASIAVSVEPKDAQDAPNSKDETDEADATNSPDEQEEKQEATETTNAEQQEEESQEPVPVGPLDTESIDPILARQERASEFIAWMQSFPRGSAHVHEVFVRQADPPCGADGVVRSEAGLTAKQWTRLLTSLRYPNNETMLDIFDDIVLECRADKKGRFVDSIESIRDDKITLAQLRRFEQRGSAATKTIETPPVRFAKSLTAKYGSTLLPWRTIIDTHGSGKVAYNDFLNACRKLGMSQLGKATWQHLKQDQTSPLEFHEFDPKEGKNLEEFAELLWKSVGFDNTRAWQFLDQRNQNFVTFAQFKAGSALLGFKGDMKKLFKGLDGSGLGRVKRPEFQYLSIVSKVGQLRLGAGKEVSKGAVTELISWAQREFGGPVQLLEAIGLKSDKDIMVSDLAARLSALGFTGDCLEAASRAARFDGGSVVTTKSLYNLCSTGKTMNPVQPRSPRPISPSSPPLKHRVGWNDGVDNISDHNQQRSKNEKGYFGSSLPGGADFRYATLTQSPRSTQSAWYRVHSKPWSESYPDTQEANVSTSSHMRQYFSDPNDKPIRTEQRQIVQSRTMQYRRAMSPSRGQMWAHPGPKRN